MWGNSLLTLVLLDSQEGLRTVQLVASPAVLIEKRLGVNVYKRTDKTPKHALFIQHHINLAC